MPNSYCRFLYAFPVCVWRNILFLYYHKDKHDATLNGETQFPEFFCLARAFLNNLVP